MKIETQCLHSGYSPKNGEARVMPISQSTTFKFDSTEHVGALFDLKETGHFYSRLSNPTVDVLEQKLAALEGGVGALCTSSGQAATTLAIMNICQSGDHIISATEIYGGTLNLLSVTLKRFGIDCTFVKSTATEEEIQKEFRPNTKLVFGETIANPIISILDIEKFATIAHKNGVPFFIDNTFATPALCRPIEYGADIVIHSTTKYLDGHAVAMGGVIIDSGNFDWAASGKFPEFTVPDESYHGLIYSEACGKAAYIVKARVQLMRDIGACQSAHGAFLTNLGTETLALRMERHSSNADKLAHYLESHDKISKVNYPTLAANEYQELYKKYLPSGASGVLSFDIKGGREAAAKFIDELKLISLVVHVADIRTCVLHPASSTHRQLSDEQLVQSGITAGLVRLSCGIENIDDIIADVEQALTKI